jgi:ActR/RegA family two-component response regulator
MTATLDVLLVEDDEPLRLLWTRTLCTAGYRVEAAGSFEEGRRALQQGCPRLLITDIRLGRHNGLQLVALVRATKRRTGMLVVTGFADPVLEIEAKRLGAEYALKPVSTDRLLTMVAEIMSGSAER